MDDNRTILEIVMDGSNLTISDLAEKVGVSERTMRYYVKGLYLPRVDVAKKIAQELHMSTDALW